ncbi:MAG: hypothetical protein VKO21_04185 [Candidatus Sericytochromatia bacterium]|nr:hypothetical protein [Candidatus Sericytochromatia bacterium]
MTPQVLPRTMWKQVLALAVRLEALHQEHRWHGQLGADTLLELAAGEFRVPEASLPQPNRWSPPEQPPEGPAADVHALAALAYEVLTGHIAFPEGSRAARPGGPARPSDLVRGLPASLDLVLLDALAPDPERRPGVRWLRQSFEGLDPETPAAEPPPDQTKLLLGTAVASLLLGSGLTYYLLGPSTPVPALRQSIGAPTASPRIDLGLAQPARSASTPSLAIEASNSPVPSPSDNVFAVAPASLAMSVASSMDNPVDSTASVPEPTVSSGPTAVPAVGFSSRVVASQGISASFNARLVAGDGLRLTLQVTNARDRALTLLGQDGSLQLVTREGEDLQAWIRPNPEDPLPWVIGPGEQAVRYVHVARDLPTSTRGLTMTLQEDGGPWVVRLVGIREEVSP